MKYILFFLLSCILFCNYTFATNTNDFTAGDSVSNISIIKPYKEVKKSYLKKLKEYEENLSETDKNIIKKYVYGAVRGEDTYLLINCYLRDNLEYFIPKKEITTPLKYRLEYYANCLSAPISKSKLPANIILYRGIDEKGITLLFKEYNIKNIAYKPVTENNLQLLKKQLLGKTFIEKGFMSTSYDIKAIKQTNFVLEIYAPKNLQALLIEDIGKRNEKEVLINKNSKWKVCSIQTQFNKTTKKNIYVITIKYVVK